MINLHSHLANADQYGWKAHYLSLLAAHGFNVPSAVALAPNEDATLLSLPTDTACAVRSSGLGEDSSTNSYAGHFRTHLGVLGLDALLWAIDDVRRSGEDEMPMAVVVQEMVAEPVCSGVAFSCHPVTTDCSVSLVSWTEGLGEGLVAGTAEGHDLEVRTESGDVVSGEWPWSQLILSDLLSALRRLDDVLGGPVDVEWCVSRDDELVLVQVRPIVLPPPAIAVLGNPEAFDALPGAIASHGKLELRAEAARRGVPMSAARAILATRTAGMPASEPFEMSEHSAGRSVVLLHPTRVEGRVVREFANDCSTDVEFFVRGCQRYAIRQYPDHQGAAASISSVLSTGLRNSAIACVIEQEILHAYATGILARTSDGYLIELALGHFVPKGFVETSTFALSSDLAVTYAEQVPQTKAYHFLNGHVIVETPPYETLEVGEDDLRGLVATMKPILDARPGVALEFGLLSYKQAHLSPYLIDIADGDADDDALSIEDARRGVVSAGRGSGPVKDLRVAGALEDLNAHLHDAIHLHDVSEGPAIFIARSASLDLLPIVRSAHPQSGFIFERASLLAHLSVILRERGIAAVVQSGEQIDQLVGTADVLRIDSSGSEMVRPAGSE